MSIEDKLRKIKSKASEIDIDFHVIILDLKWTKISIAMAAPKEIINSYRYYQTISIGFNTEQFLNWCITRQIKVYCEESDKNPLSKLKAYIYNRYFKSKGLYLDENMTTLFAILDTPSFFLEITKTKTEKQKIELITYIERKIDSIIEFGY